MGIFNYRLSRAPCIVENVFDILAQRWRVYTGRLQVGPETQCSEGNLNLHTPQHQPKLLAIAIYEVEAEEE